jgi:general secretion pathway protein D
MISARICTVALLLALSPAVPADEVAPAGDASRGLAGSGPTVEVVDLIGRVARRTGKQFVVDPRVRGPVPMTGIDLDKLDHVRLLAILRANQYAAFEASGVVNVVPAATARQLPIPVTTSVDPQKLDDELVTVLIQGKNVCAAHTVPILRPLLPQEAHLAAMPQTNTLVISDRAANARRIIDMFERLDQQAAANKGCSDTATKASSPK